MKQIDYDIRACGDAGVSPKALVDAKALARVVSDWSRKRTALHTIDAMCANGASLESIAAVARAALAPAADGKGP